MVRGVLADLPCETAPFLYQLAKRTTFFITGLNYLVAVDSRLMGKVIKIVCPDEDLILL